MKSRKRYETKKQIHNTSPHINPLSITRYGFFGDLFLYSKRRDSLYVFLYFDILNEQRITYTNRPIPTIAMMILYIMFPPFWSHCFFWYSPRTVLFLVLLSCFCTHMITRNLTSPQQGIYEARASLSHPSFQYSLLVV